MGCNKIQRVRFDTQVYDGLQIKQLGKNLFNWQGVVSITIINTGNSIAYINGAPLLPTFEVYFFAGVYSFNFATQKNELVLPVAECEKDITDYKIRFETGATLITDVNAIAVYQQRDQLTIVYKSKVNAR